jgi:glycosyltransferase involved in cell wall biosynthesis
MKDTAVFLRRAPEVDVLLLLEGTFPYVSGGVSNWVHDLICGFPQLRFGAIFLGSRRSDYGEACFALPTNLLHLECHFLHENLESGGDRPQALAGDAAAYSRVRELHAGFREEFRGMGALESLLAELVPMLGDDGPLSERSFLHSREAWSMVTQNYTERCSDPSFIDYFWSVRIMHAPLWLLARIAHNAPRTRALHTVSTGYAGFLGVLLHHVQHRPLLLSEHGIYTKERKIDLFQASWIRDNRGVLEKASSQLAYFRDLWIRFFEALGRSCYASSAHIVSLYEANRQRQIADGAPGARTLCIANGIDVARFAPARSARQHDASGRPPLVACLIGRVVPIKDIRTFLHSIRSVIARLPQAQGWIAGPTQEDPDYFDKCRMTVVSLGLENHVRFLGHQEIESLLPRIGLVVLSSISEALPLSILEGFAGGVPCVSTDVGSCRQLVFGLGEEDQALGAAGAVVRIADPQALGEEIVALLDSPERWRAAQAAACARVERYYTREHMLESYAQLYAAVLDDPSPVAARSWDDGATGAAGKADHGRHRI